MDAPGTSWLRLRWQIARRQRQWLRGWVAWALSLCVHLGLSLWGVTLVADAEVAGDPPRPAPSGDEIGIELVEMLRAPEADVAPDPRHRVDSEPAYGGDGQARPDTGRAGRGGDVASQHAAVNLAPMNDEAHLTPSLRSRLDRAQEARRRSANARRSPEDDAVSGQPMILTFTADGAGMRHEPRPNSSDPSGGSFSAAEARRAGSGLGLDARRPRGDGERAYEAGDGYDGNADHTASGAGVRDRAAGRNTHAAADVARGRPMVTRGRDSARAGERGQLQDDVDAEQEVSARAPSFLAASGPGGERGQGRGGEPGDGDVASGGANGPGHASRARGSGKGNGTAIDPADARRRAYLRRVWRKIQNSWSVDAFPREAVLEGRGGYTIVSFIIGKKGEVTSIATARPSGFPGFDAAMRRAVLAAGPFGQPPDDLAAPFRHTHDFIVQNPAVR